MAAILFLMRYPLEGWDNLKSKFNGQMAAAEALGYEAWCIGWDRKGMWLCRGDEKTLLRTCPLTRMPAYSKTFLYVDLMEALKEALRRKHFDVVYMRYMRYFHNAPAALAQIKKQGGKLILEHPTYPFSHGRTTSLLRAPVFWYNDRVFAKIEPLLDLYTLIGDPCGPTLNGVPAINIVNGVDAGSLTPHHPRTEGPLGLLALASMSRWQGYDRLIEALAAYKGSKDVRIHMVGGEGDGSLAEWKKLCEERGVADRVIFHGELFGEALDDVTAQCDVGIGGLGLYRIGQFQSMTLKLREYMARGLPFVYAVDDPSVPDEPRFCMRLPNDDTPLSMEDLTAFALRTRQDSEAPELMRAYARDHMSWQAILKTILESVGME